MKLHECESDIVSQIIPVLKLSTTNNMLFHICEIPSLIYADYITIFNVSGVVLARLLI